MAYEDFNINEKMIEEMAKEFEKTKIMSDEQAEEEDDDTQNLMYDIFSGAKILERLLFLAKGQTKNQRLLNFIHNSQTVVETLSQELLKMKNDILINDIDFELPQDDMQIISLIRNILASLLSSLASLVQNGTSNAQISKLIIVLSDLLKDSLNI